MYDQILAKCTLEQAALSVTMDFTSKPTQNLFGLFKAASSASDTVYAGSAPAPPPAPAGGGETGDEIDREVEEEDDSNDEYESGGDDGYKSLAAFGNDMNAWCFQIWDWGFGYCIDYCCSFAHCGSNPDASCSAIPGAMPYS